MMVSFKIVGGLRMERSCLVMFDVGLIMYLFFDVYFFKVYVFFWCLICFYFFVVVNCDGYGKWWNVYDYDMFVLE